MFRSIRRVHAVIPRRFLLPSAEVCEHVRLQEQQQWRRQQHHEAGVVVRCVRAASSSSSSSTPPTPEAPEAASSTTPEAPASGCGRPIGESIPMPDKEEEMKLSRIQTTISNHYKRGDFTKALAGSHELLTKTQAHFGKDHPATASAYNNVGLMQKLLGDFVEARKHYSTAMRIYGKVVGRDHASYAMTLHNMGALNKSQVHFDTSLKAVDRLSLVEQALEHFEEAMTIRKAELGDTHPHTVATKSSYGSTLAAQVLHQHRFVEGNKEENRKPQYVSLNPKSVTDEGWKAAEDHLREALRIAIDNPRGQGVHRSKKQKHKPRRKPSATSGNGIETLSAAAAAQNLAVFLKSHAMTDDPPQQELLQEAKALYYDVQMVRSRLLPKAHPDLYSTQYSLAELLDAMDEEEEANVIRQDILDTYDPSDEESSTAKNVTPPPNDVVVSKHNARTTTS